MVAKYGIRAKVCSLGHFVEHLVFAKIWARRGHEISRSRPKHNKIIIRSNPNELIHENHQEIKVIFGFGQKYPKYEWIRFSWVWDVEIILSNH